MAEGETAGHEGEAASSATPFRRKGAQDPEETHDEASFKAPKS